MKVYYLKDIIINTIIINKSKFIATIIPVSSIEDINNNLDKIRKEYWDATHNCYAYLLGDNLEIQKCSDDGEPQKTAGFPMLDVLKKRGLTNVLAVVTRYFGGTLLGASGLIKAYSSSVSLALDKATFYQQAKYLEFNLACDYKEYNTISKLSYIEIKDILYQSDIKLIAIIKEKDRETLERDLTNLFKIKVNLSYKEVIALEKVII